jgi:enoyl-CoA hydratase/carnithine racemase
MATLRTEVDDGIGWLVYDNPERHNAVSRSMLDALPAALAALVADDAVRVIVLRGAGERAFISGADIGELGATTARPEAGAVDEGFGAAELSACPKPVVAMIHGYCFGGGVLTALCADLRIAADDAVFSIPAARLGVAYPMAAVAMLDRLVGPANTAEILMTARRYGAAEAAAMGLVNRVVPKAELETHVRELATQLAANAPLTIRAAKVALREVAKAPADRDAAAWQHALEACFASEDFTEGRRAFAERRPPRFTGH